jgi:hypothetical protein
MNMPCVGQGEPAAKPWEAKAAGWMKAFESQADVSAVDEQAKALLADPQGLKAWLDQLAGRSPGEGAAMEFKRALASGGPRRPAAARFLERGVPATEADLTRQYNALRQEGGPASFKQDLQSIERAILTGSAEALREIAKNSPMALWAMDFSLAEYEDENALAFAAKYAPTGPDEEVVQALLDLGAALPPRRLRLPVGAIKGGAAAGVWAKPVAEVARALEKAGYQFGAADGLALLASAHFERHESPGLPSMCAQKIQWLEEIGRRAGVDWGGKWSAQQARELVAGIPDNLYGSPERAAAHKVDFVERASRLGPQGLGAWVGMAQAPLRQKKSWEELAPWMDERGLMDEIQEAAIDTGAKATLDFLEPWLQKAALRKASLEAQGPKGEVAERLAARL